MSYSHSRKPDVPFNSLLSLKYGLAYCSFFPPLLKPRCQGRVMGFVGGCGNIAITTVLIPSSIVCCIVNIKEFMEFIYLIFYACLRLQFLDVERNHGPRRPVPGVCRILSSNLLGLAGILSDLTVASCPYDILFCLETLVTDMRHMSELLVPSFCRPVLLSRGKMPRARGIAAYIRDGYGAFRQPKFEYG